MAGILDQTLALAGLFRAITAVDAVAYGRPLSTEDQEALYGATLNQNPETVRSLLPADALLQVWAREAGAELGGRTGNTRVLAYLMQLLDLSQRLERAPANVRRLADLLQETSSADPERLSDLYVQTISTLGRRLQISGDPEVLQREQTAARVRSLLLAGIRFAWLWRQLGGRRWHLIFKRQTLVQQLQHLEESL